jgi:zinc protease
MRKLFLILTIFLLPAVGLSQAKAATGSEITEFDVNGLKVIVKRRPASPTVAAGLFVRGGVRNQSAENAGIESLTLSVAAEGSTKFPRSELRREMSRTGSSIGSGMNYDFSVISLTSTRANFDRTWEIFTDVVLSPSFTAEDLALVRERFLTGLRNQSVTPEGALETLQDRILYNGHPYAVEPTGTIESINRFKTEDLRNYHRSLLQTSRLLLVLVGDVDPETVKKGVADSFGKLPRGTYAQEPLPKLRFERPTVDVTQRSLPTNYIKGVFAAPSLADPDYHAMRVAITILQSRVYQEVRIRRNLSYAPNADMENYAANTANISVTAVDANETIGVMLREIQAMKNHIDAEAYEGIPGYFLTTYYIAQETNAAQVAELARYELIGGGWRRSLDFLNKIREVKPADIQAAANKYMKNIRFFVLGDPRAVDRNIFTSME